MTNFTLAVKRNTPNILYIVGFLSTTLMASSQSQTIGSYPSIQGGFEKFGASSLSQIPAYISGSQYTSYFLNNGANNSASYNSLSPRSGSRMLSWKPGGSANSLFTPTVPNSGFKNNTSYTIQFYYATSSSDPFPAGATPTVAISSDGTEPFAIGPRESTDIDFTASPNLWTKKTVTVKSGSSTSGNKYGTVIFTSNNIGVNNIYFDDLVIYEGDTEDNIAPGSPLNISALSASATSIKISWNAPNGGIDGGGYMLVRSLQNDTITPNENGIYGKENNIGSGKVAYIGNATSFTDEGLTQGVAYYYSVYAVDKAFNYSPGVTAICIPQAQGFASILTENATVESGNTLIAGGNVMSDGGANYPVLQRGIVWATHPDPIIGTDSFLLLGKGTGNFSDSITKLPLGTLFYVRAYAVTAAGTSYGQTIAISSFSWPVVSRTFAVTWLSFSSITTGVKVDSTGGDITKRGVCWNTTGMPTILDSNTVDGTSLYPGASVSNIEYLLPHTTYYVRGYATNKLGTVYGPEIAFRTLSVYYNVAGADISKLSGWNTMPDGSGTAPLNFTADSFAYNIRNAGSYLGADLVITGKASRIVVGDGFNPISFTLPDDHIYNGLIDVRNGGVLYIRSIKNPKYNFIYTGSTVNFDGTKTLTIPKDIRFYNLGSTNDNGATRIFPKGLIFIAGAFSTGKAVYDVETDNAVLFNGTDKQIIPAFEYQKLHIYSGKGATAEGRVVLKDTLFIHRQFSIPFYSSLILENGSSTSITPQKKLLVQGLFENRSINQVNPSNEGEIIIQDSGVYKINGYEGNTAFSAFGFTFLEGSTLYINSGQPALPAYVGGHVIWDTKAKQGSRYSSTTFLRTTSGDNTIIGGDLVIKNTNTGAVNNGWNGITGKKLIVRGNMEMQGGEYDINASPENYEAQTLTIKGNLIVTGGKLFASISNYSGGNINIMGNLLHTGGEFGAQVNITNGKLLFNGSELQNIRTRGLSNSISAIIDNVEGVSMITDLSINSSDTSALLLKNGTLHIGSNVLSVKGGLISDENNGNIDATVGTLILNGNNTQKLSCNILNESIKNLKIDNNKDVISEVPLKVETLTLENGKLWISDNNISCNKISKFDKDRYIITDGKGALKINNIDSRKGAVTFPVGSSRKSYNPVLLTNNGRTDNYSINIKCPFDIAGLTMDTSKVVNVQYKIAEDVEGGSNVDITLQWNNENENSGFKTTNEGGNVVIGQWVDSFWMKSPARSFGTNPFTASATGIPYVTTFVIGNAAALINASVPKPVITPFYGKENGNDVDLFWSTNIEINVKEYSIERGINPTDFNAIGVVSANGFGWQHDYKYVDGSAPGGIVYYRLKIINTDGSYFYSQVISVSLKREVRFAVFPNPVPAGSSINIMHNLSSDNASITIISANGIKTAYAKILPGTIQTRFNCSSLAQGVYILQYEENGIRKTTKFIKSDE